MKKILIVLILFIFSFPSIATSEDFPDGKYFASIYSNTYNGDKPRWTVIINKTINSIEIISLSVTKSKLGVGCCTLEIPDMEFSKKFGSTELVNNKFDFGKIRFIEDSDVQLWFYGNLGKFSKLTFSLFSSTPIEARFKWVPYKYYDNFIKKFTWIFLKSIWLRG